MTLVAFTLLSQSSSLSVRAAPPETTIPAPDYGSFETCEQPMEALPAQVWADCSTAYNVDRGRGEMILVSFLGLLLLTVIALALAVRS